MLPAHIRDQHRARSLRLSQHNRQLALAPSSASPSKTTARVRGHGGAGAASKGSSTAAAKAALEDEVREARGELEHEQPGNSAGADGEQARQQGKETAIEVLLESLVVPSRRNTASDFEIIRTKGVIALDDRDFGTSSSPEFGAQSAEAEEDDEWELLGLDDDEGAVKEVKPQAKSWASVVRRA